MIGIKKIDVKYSRPYYDCVRFTMEWQNEEGIRITITGINERTFDIDWNNNGQMKETDYYNNRGREVNEHGDCTGIRVPLPGNNEYGNQVIALEFIDGTTIEYHLPADGNKFLREMEDYVGTQYEAVPGRTELATAARLLDDEMQYEI